MDIIKATHRFAQWLGQYTTLARSDLNLKHQRMAESPFFFFRATFYRWMQLWPKICPDLSKAPGVLAVGDVHVENFGTWRDIEGRLVWGVNDFDEAAVLSYTIDLVRLATSALLAIEEGHLTVKTKDACGAILSGYEQSMVEGGRPFVLEEENTWLRRIATSELRDPVHFWQKLGSLQKFQGRIPAPNRLWRVSGRNQDWLTRSSAGSLVWGVWVTLAWWPSRNSTVAGSRARRNLCCLRLSTGSSRRKLEPSCSIGKFSLRRFAVPIPM